MGFVCVGYLFKAVYRCLVGVLVAYLCGLSRFLVGEVVYLGVEVVVSEDACSEGSEDRCCCECAFSPSLDFVCAHAVPVVSVCLFCHSGRFS